MDKPTLPPMKVPPPPAATVESDQPARGARGAQDAEPLAVEAENIRVRRLRNLPTRTSKRPEELEPSAQFVNVLEALGPRDGESELAFQKRMAMIRGVRRVWMDLWRKLGGNRPDCAKALGIPLNNVTFELRVVGLSVHILNEWVLGRLEIPR